MAISRRLKLVLFCSGSAGDVRPFIELGSALVARGHQVNLVTHHGYARQASRGGLKHHAFDTAEQYAEFLRNGDALNTPRGLPSFLRDHSFPRINDALNLLCRHSASDTLLITSPTFDTASRMAAEKLGIRALWLFMAPVQVAQWALQRKMRDAMYRVMLGEDINRIRSDSGMPPVEDWDSWLQYSNQSIGQWPAWFAPPDDRWLPGVNPVGFLIDQPGDDRVLPPEVLDYLDAADRKPLLITGGTGRYLNERFYSVCIGAAKSLDVRAIAVTRDQDLLPKDLPDDLLLVERLPFAALMPRCRAVIHHGGLGTIGTAAAAGIPQVILASGADRPDNGARVESLGIGEHHLLTQSSSDRLVHTLAALEQPDVHVRCNEVAGRILEHDAVDSACRVVEQFAAQAASGP